MGLVEGYNSMGYEMSKPDLRAELEADLKLVSEGRKDKASVLSYHVAKYKAVFIESVRKAKKLDEALSNYLGPAQEFTEQEQDQLEIPLPVRKCPQCNRDMVLKKKKDSTGMFLSCMGYPACKAAVWFPDTVLEVSRDESVCQTCRPHPVHMLKFKFKRGSLPPMMPLEFVGCIGGCDETLREVLNLRYLRGGEGDSISRTNNNSTSRQPYVQRTNSAPPSRSENGRPPASRPRPDTNRPPASLPPLQPPASAQGGAIVCNCGLDAVLLTVRKDGPNQGRQFYKCNTGDCKFFLWADQPSEQGVPGGSRGPLSQTSQPPRPSVGFGNMPQQRQNNRGSGSNEGETMCNCNEPAVTRTVMKDGPNKGRMFHTCGKPRDQQCGFFQWANENVAPATDFPEGNNGRHGGNKKTTTASTKPPAAKRQRTCGLCHEPGHTRVTCPQGR